MSRIDTTQSSLPQVSILWPHAIDKLKDAIKHITDNMLSQIQFEQKSGFGYHIETHEETVLLISRLLKFPDTLSYTINEHNGTVLITSTDKYLEKAMFYGTRKIPRIKPLEIVAKYIGEAIGVTSPVFISEPFEQHENIDYETNKKHTNSEEIKPNNTQSNIGSNN